MRVCDLFFFMRREGGKLAPSVKNKDYHQTFEKIILFCLLYDTLKSFAIFFLERGRGGAYRMLEMTSRIFNFF